MMTNNNKNTTYWLIVRVVLGVAAAVLMIIAMITDRHNTYLTLGLTWTRLRSALFLKN